MSAGRNLVEAVFSSSSSSSSAASCSALAEKNKSGRESSLLELKAGGLFRFFFRFDYSPKVLGTRFGATGDLKNSNYKIQHNNLRLSAIVI